MADLKAATGAAAGIGGLATAVTVSVCCVVPVLGPLVISVLGIGPTVALMGLRPYAVPMFAISGILIGISVWQNTRRRPCEAGRCATFIRSTSRVFSWLSVLTWLGAVVLVWTRAR